MFPSLAEGRHSGVTARRAAPGSLRGLAGFTCTSHSSTKRGHRGSENTGLSRPEAPVLTRFRVSPRPPVLVSDLPTPIGCVIVVTEFHHVACGRPTSKEAQVAATEHARCSRLCEKFRARTPTCASFDCGETAAAGRLSTPRGQGKSLRMDLSHSFSMSPHFNRIFRLTN